MFCNLCACWVRCNITAETNHKPASSVTYSLDQLPGHMENYETVSIYITSHKAKPLCRRNADVILCIYRVNNGMETGLLEVSQ